MSEPLNDFQFPHAFARLEATVRPPCLREPDVVDLEGHGRCLLRQTAAFASSGGAVANEAGQVGGPAVSGPPGAS